MPDTKMTAAEALKARLRLAQEFQKPKFETFAEIDQVVHMRGKAQPGTAQIHAPDSWADVETVAPRMVSRRPTVLYRPRREGDEAGSKVRQALFDYWWDRDDAFTKTVRVVKGGLTHGRKLVKWSWATETEEVRSHVYGPDRRPAMEAQVERGPNGEVVQVIPLELVPQEALQGAGGRLAEEVAEVTTYDDPRMEPINIYDFFIDPEATGLQDASWLIFRYRRSLEELRGYKRFTRLADLERELSAGSFDSEEKEFKDQQRRAAGTGVLEADDTVDRVTCYEMWQRGPRGREVCTVTASGTVIEDWSPNPFWHGRYPFSEFVDSWTGDGYWDAAGEVEPVMYLQYALDTLLSMDVDNRVRAIEPKWKVDGNVDEREIWEGPVIHTSTRTGDDATPIEVPDLTPTSAQGIEQIRSLRSNALGIFDVNRGDSPAGNTTASGLATVAEQGNARFNLKIQQLESFFKDMGFFVAALYEQNLTDEKVLRVAGPDGAEAVARVMPQDVAGDYDVDVESGSSRPANPEAERQDALQAYQLAMGSPAAQDPQFQQEALEFALDKFEGASKLKESLQQAMRRLQEAAQQQQQVVAQQEQQQAALAEQEGRSGDAQARVQYYQQADKQLGDEIARLQASSRRQPAP